MAKFVCVRLKMHDEEKVPDVIDALSKGPGVARVCGEGNGIVTIYVKTSKLETFVPWMEDMALAAQPKM